MNEDMTVLVASLGLPESRITTHRPSSSAAISRCFASLPRLLDSVVGQQSKIEVKIPQPPSNELIAKAGSRAAVLRPSL